jgi:alpha-mannosidase
MNVLEYALLPHAENVYTSQVSRSAEIYNATPLAVQNPIRRERPISRDKLVSEFSAIETMTSHIRSQLDGLKMADLNILKVQNKTLIISAFKKAEEGEALIVRLYNPDVQPACDVQMVFGVDIQSGYLTDFNEKERARLEQMNSRVLVLPEVKPHSAVTMKFLLAGID